MVDMIDIQLNYHLAAPLYQQIAEQLRQGIATEQIKPGDRLPSIRQLSQSLGVNPNTVARAYLELEQEQIIVSRRGGGTTVMARGEAPGARAARQKRLLENVSEDIIKTLSQGYSPEELEAAFYLSLERWREERQIAADELTETPTAQAESNVIHIVGSHDLALNILLDLLRQRKSRKRWRATSAAAPAMSRLSMPSSWRVNSCARRPHQRKSVPLTIIKR